MEVLLSIIIPMYNAEAYIESTLSSALDGVDNRVEIIVVDDGGNDNSFSICENYDDPRVHLYRQENSGAPAARNKGLLEARGEYVLFFDADDFFETGAVNRILFEISESRHDCYVGNFYRFDGKSSVLEYKDLHWMKSLYSYYMFTPSPNSKVFRRSILRENNLRFENIRLAQDLNFYMKFLGVSQDVKVIEYPFFHYRYVPQSISHVTDDRILDIEKSIDGAIAYYESMNSERLCYSYAYLNGIKHTNYQLYKLLYVDDTETISKLYPELKRIWNKFFTESKPPRFEFKYYKKKWIDAIIQYYYRFLITNHINRIKRAKLK